MNQAFYDYLIDLGFPLHFAARIASEDQAKNVKQPFIYSAEECISSFAIWSGTKEGFAFWAEVANVVREKGVAALFEVEIPQ